MTKDLLSDLIKDVEKALNSGSVPDYFMEANNHYLSKAILDSFCKDRPYSALYKSVQKDFDNIHKFI